MARFNKPQKYQAYLLRFWGERVHLPEDDLVWRFSLEDPHTGERRGFADLQALLRFLADQVGESADPEPPDHVAFLC